MKPNLNILLLGAALAIGGCNRNGDAAPTGQVVATVDGKEITLEDLHAETGGLNPGLGADERKAAERAALQQIIARTIISDYAREQELDRTPVAAILRKRAEQEALVGMVQRKLTGEAPQPAREEVELFVRDHPSSFAQRRIFVVDQITAGNLPASVVKELNGYTTLAEVREAYAKAGVKYTQTVGTIDALAIDAEAAEKLASLPVGTMFVSPERNLVRVNLIRTVDISPITGEDANRLAREIILNGRVNALAQRQLSSIVGKGMAKVRYNAAYRPAENPSGQARAGAGAPQQ